MIQEINYQGLSNVPSDYQSADGTMASVINLVPENNQLNPVFQPKVVASLPSGYNIIYIHNTASYTSYIISKKSGLSYNLYAISQLTETISESTINQGELTFNEQPTQILGINSIGNTLIITTNQGMRYYLREKKTVQPIYKLLGDHIPELPIVFSLKGTSVVSSQSVLDISSYPWRQQDLIPEQGEEVIINNEEMTAYMSEAILGKVNKFINDESLENGKFLFPFFVRYAFRLFDGTTVMQSSPVLMVTDSCACPHVVCTNWVSSLDEETSKLIVQRIYYRVFAMLFDLEYRTNDTMVNTLKNWSDIVKSVDIFASAPLYQYDQAGKIKGLSYYEADKKGFTISKLSNDAISAGDGIDVGSYYFRRPVAPQFPNYASLDDSYGKIEVIIPTHSESNINESISSCANFYMLKSISVDDIKSEDTIDIQKGHLSSLTSRETLNDDYDSHDKILPSFTHTYNSRFHVGRIVKYISDINNADAFCCKNDYALKYNVTTNTYDATSTHGTASYKLYVYIKQEGDDIVVTHNQSDFVTMGIDIESHLPFLFLYYPNPNAYKAVLYINKATPLPARTYTLPLKKHDFLNGAYYFGGFDAQHSSGGSTKPTTSSTEGRKISLPNKLYTSEVGNPFYFPVTNINTIGTGDIIGIASASKALSQGQFGQFPLYAFCTDGVWAMSVNDTGGYAAIQPITRDVCTNKDSITSTDSEVLFATDRGIMMLSGSQSACISEPLSAEQPFNVLSKLPKMADIHALLGHTSCNCFPTTPYMAFIKGCRVMYDYLHQRVIFSNSNYTYSYIFSLKSQQWGMMYSNISSPVNSYPEAMAMTTDNKLVTFSDTSETKAKCLLVSRPIKLCGAEVMKSIHSIIQRGAFSRGDTSVVLYGSRDMEHWFIIGSSKDHLLRNLRGTAYKYFRIASVAELGKDESIFGASVDFDVRATNQLR